MKHILSLLATLALSIHAADLVPLGCTKPALTAEEAAITPSADTIWPLRRATTLCVGTQADGTIQVNVKNKHITVFNQTLAYSLTDSNGQTILKGTLGKDETLNLHTPPLPQGIYYLHVDAGGNAVHVTEPKSPCFVEATAMAPLQMIWGCPMLYFLTQASPDGKLHLCVKGQESEHAVLNVWDADGKKVYEKSSFQNNSIRNPTLKAAIPVPKEQVGRIWRIQLTPDPSPRVRFEDMAIWIESGAVPCLAMSPSTLAVPDITKVFFTKPDGSSFIGARIAKPLASRADFALAYTFTPVPGSGSQADAATALNDVANSCIGLTVPKGKNAFGELRIAVKSGSGFNWKWDDSVFISQEELFNEVVLPEPGTPAGPTDEDKKRGYQLFQREEPGYVRRQSCPATDEIITVLKAEASGGMVSTEFFAIRPLRNFESATKLSVTDLKGPNGAILPASCVTLYNVNRWPQKEAYYSITFQDMPELMIPNSVFPATLYEGIPQLYAVQATIPADAVPGVYHGTISLDGSPALPYELTVDDFAVPEVPTMTFGLYPDTKRWKQLNYTDDEIVREMKFFRDYGITALLMYPLVTGQLQWDGQKLHVNLAEFRRQIQLYKQCGFYGVMVIDVQDAIRFVLPKLIGVKSFDDSPLCEKAFGDLLDAIRQAAEEDQWPEYCLHTVDEPYTDERARAAIKTLTFVKNRGFKTFNTTYVDVVRKHLAPYLDYRCYCAMNYHTFSSGKVADEIRKETLEDGDALWWYGSGCYSGVNNQQDGNIYLNRHMLGLFNWRIKATGAWSWTFLRAYGNQFDDFDDRKEDCLCYQDTQTHVLIDTLQWEAVREGTYDHRYLTLWEQAVAKAKGVPELRQRAEQSEKTVTAAVNAIPWMARDRAVSNGQLRALRKLVISELKALKAVLPIK